ncbi:MAG: DUF3769 domain-containing protein [Cyanobacteria bacterium CRU_2_1]|nr:DUF3769 domain-containing protein [Cyanobacteria bacterium RU_5_0]NJR61468.1 DUF3769 domain-containing protein [Cyanobacteria bacterium CRU_2_1]
MPYPVPPPPPPAIVDVLPPEELNDSAPTLISAPTAESTLEFAQGWTFTSSVDPFESCANGGSAGGCGNPSLPSPERAVAEESIEGSALTAESLGSPVEISLSVSPPEFVFSSSPVLFSTDSGTPSSAVHPPIFVYQPDLYRLTEGTDISPPVSFERSDARSDSEDYALQESVPQSPTEEPASPSDALPETPDEGEEDNPDELPPVPEPPGETLTIPGQQSPLPSVEPLPPPSPSQDTPTEDGSEEESQSPQSPLEEEPTPPPETPPPGTPPTGTPPTDAPPQDIIELEADRQEYDERAQVFRAEGNVELRFRGAVVNADRLQVSVPNRVAVAEGNASITRGQQVLRGDRIVYNLTQDSGTVTAARGEISLSTISTDLGPTEPGLATDVTTGATIVPLSETLNAPLQVLGSAGGLTVGTTTPGQGGLTAGATGTVSRLRYEADQISFNGPNIQASNVRITNDPFSPPELELRSNNVTVMPISPTQTEIRARNPRLVFDQGFSLPLLRDRAIIDNRERSPGLVEFGFDERDRGGFFIQRDFDVLVLDGVSFRVTPQILVQRAIDEGGFGDPSSYGLIAQLNVTPSPRTIIEGRASFSSLDISEWSGEFRGSLRARQLVAAHTVALEYSYRDRLFNGSLGFQNVQNSLGLVVTSPRIVLGDSLIELSYQASVQLVNANVNGRRVFVEQDQALIDLLPEADEFGARPNFRIDLVRYQASAALNRFFFLWVGTALPPTPEEGLRYTPNPVVPYLATYVGARGVFSAYSNGDTQSTLTGTVGILGQFGNFSRPFLDFTGINISYSVTALDGDTPFDFDRVNDLQTLGLSITQQIYGPFRFSVQSTIFLDRVDTDELDSSTILSLEYSRRSYSITLSYNPERESGAVSFRINDFNWVGDPGPFTGLGARSVSGGL